MRRLCTHYESLDHDAKQAALFLLSVDFGLRHDDVITSASELIRLQAQASHGCMYRCITMFIQVHYNSHYIVIFTIFTLF